jgi:hypothetical protein
MTFPLRFKTKITAEGRDSCKETGNLRSFCQRPDAARAQGLANQTSVLQHSHFLKIGTEGPVGSALREAAVVTKGRGFTTSIALSHFRGPFSAIIAFDETSPSRQ